MQILNFKHFIQRISPRLTTLITLHLSTLNGSSFLFDQATAASKSVCRRVASSAVSMMRRILLWSAYNFIQLSFERKSSGPKTDPWGTTFQSEKWSPIATRCLWSDNQALIHSRSWPLIPYTESLCRSHRWRTLFVERLGKVRVDHVDWMAAVDSFRHHVTRFKKFKKVCSAALLSNKSVLGWTTQGLCWAPRLAR